MSSRRKNPHPQRAVNARTVLKAEKEEPLVLCLRIPDDAEDLEANHHQIQKEETTFKKKGVKRKRTQHECDVCEKRFRDSYNLKKHVHIHTNEKPYECDVCEKRFRESGHLQYHMRIHAHEKAYECDECETRFSQSGNLKRHTRIHTNEKPHKCDVCDKAFSQSGHLKRHKRTQH